MAQEAWRAEKAALEQEIARLRRLVAYLYAELGVIPHPDDDQAAREWFESQHASEAD